MRDSRSKLAYLYEKPFHYRHQQSRQLEPSYLDHSVSLGTSISRYIFTRIAVTVGGVFIVTVGDPHMSNSPPSLPN